MRKDCNKSAHVRNFHAEVHDVAIAQRHDNTLRRRGQYGFTLVELLVVVSIIALLVSILIPALRQAKFQAYRIYCLNNIKNQYLAQVTYAMDSNGEFAPHTDFTPTYVRSNQPPNSNYCHKAMDRYVEDPKIFLCPLQRTFGLAFSDLEYTWAEYGGWNGVDVLGNPQKSIWTAYSWFANFVGLGLGSPARPPQFSFDSHEGIFVNEPEWPRKYSECTDSKAFIAHDISWTPQAQWNLWYDRGHDGQISSLPGSWSLDEVLSCQDNPLGYADGHVIYTLKNNIKPRARIAWGNTEIYY